ncbi:hypothetical protein LZ30DRAFT_724061 [Colletotrichum cereale]|nr:hypothetical protein LZ30DRAFT_724061 [Colletotrichum cereale]
MKLFSLLTYCTATFASIAPLTTNLTNTDVKVREAGKVVETAYQPSLTKLLSRDSESAYEEARRAAGRAGRSLSAGTWYYFMNCNDLDEEYGYEAATTRKGLEMMQTYHCSHVGLVVGKTSWTGRKFKATLIHLRAFTKGLDQTYHQYMPFDTQRLIWGGKTRESKANTKRLLDAGIRWLNGATGITEEHNCMTYYEYLVSLL